MKKCALILTSLMMVFSLSGCIWHDGYHHGGGHHHHHYR